MSLLPVTWIEGWPIVGKVGTDGIGGMVWSGKKPVQGKPIVLPQTDDTFNARNLSSQWEWNYQPRSEKWSLKDRRGWLRLQAFQPLRSNDLLSAGNTLTQRSMRTEASEVVIKLDLTGMTDGQKAGLCHFAVPNYSSLGVVQEGASRKLVYRQNDQTIIGPELKSDDLWIRSVWGFDGRSQYSYSQDGRTFTDFGAPHQLMWGDYRGDRIGMYNYNDISEAGYIDVDFFRYSYKIPEHKRG